MARVNFTVAGSGCRARTTARSTVVPALAPQQHRGVGQRHVARRHAADGLDHVAGGEARLRGRRTGDRAHHAHVAELLGEDQPDVGALHVLGLEVFLVLIGIQIAGERIDRFQHAVQRAQGDALHVGLFDVLALNARNHVAEHANVFVGVVGGERSGRARCRSGAEA